MDQFEAAIGQPFMESCRDLAQGEKFHRGKIPAGGAELVDHAKQMIRRARHGFCRQEFGFQHSFFSQRRIFRKLHAFLRSDRKEKAQMFAQGEARPTSHTQQFAQFGRWNESDAEHRNTAIEQQAFDRIRVIAKRHRH